MTLQHSKRGVRAFTTLALVALTAAMMSSVALAQTRDSRQAQQRLAIRDIALGENRALVGRVADRQGKPLASVDVLLRDNNQRQFATKSRADGTFAFTEVSAGVCQLRTRHDVQICRVWAPLTAPPSARNSVLLYEATSVVRGQCCCPTPCNSCCAEGGKEYAGEVGEPTYAVQPPRPQVSVEQLRELAPDLPEEQYAAFSGADMVIVNPDHYSVVIQYDPVQGTAIVTSKALDEVALQIQAAARASGVPIIRRPPLARALFDQVAVGQMVPGDLLSQIVDILAELAPAAPLAPATFVEPGFQPGPGISPRAFWGAAIIGTAVAIPVAVGNDSNDHQSGS